MKKITYCIIIIGLLFNIGCNYAKQGAVIGGLTGAAGSAIGKGDRRTTAILGGIGAATGYMIGNELDKRNQHNIPPYNNQNYNNPNYNYNNPNQNYNNYSQPRTDCHKVIIRNTDSSGRIFESVEERCEGQKTEMKY